MLLTLSKLDLNCSPPNLTFPWPKKQLGHPPMVRRPAHVQSPTTARPPKLKRRKAYVNDTPAFRHNSAMIT